MGSMHQPDNVMPPAQRAAWSRLWHRLLQPVDDDPTPRGNDDQGSAFQDATPDEVNQEDGVA